jgi:hypothetical protein
MLYPEVGRSMSYFKYIINHNELFTHPKTATFVALYAVSICIAAEILNIYMLLNYKDIEYTIIYFVALVIIVEIPHMYVSSLLNDKLKD